MKTLTRLLILLITLAILHNSYFIIHTSPAHAAENFITDYDVSYIVKDDGVTHANMKVTLTNAANDYYYASSYKIELGFDHLTNISASDLGGSITPQIDKTNTGYTFELDFNKKVVGMGNKQIFTLAFDTTDIAQKQGKIWEINIPGIDDEKSFNSFTVNLTVPKSFGDPAYVKPVQKEKKLQFTKEDLAKSGISLAFGDKQQYSFTLLYHLQNKNLFPIRTEIALPPNTNYQDVLIDAIEPAPVQVKKDDDGNWLAEYELRSTQEIDIKVKGRVNLFLYPRKEQLSDKDLSKYLAEKPHWQVSNERIQSLAKSLKTPDAIYRYVMDTLEYDFSRVTNSNNRLGAIGVLDKPSEAVCLEFTDLFISIARAAGIPAREVDGYAYTENPRQRPLSLVSDVLHAWPEYYDKEKETWIMVDPTWGDTTGGVDYFLVLDFDHFAFVKKGVSSTYPIPAGGYKVNGKEERKDVFIYPSQDDFVKENTLILSSMMKSTYIAGFPIEGRATVVNTGPSVNKGEELQILAPGLSPREQSIAIDELLPYEKRDIVFHFEKQPFLTNKSYLITMQVANKEYSKRIKITPLFFENWKLIGGIIGVVLATFILITTFKARRIRVSR